MAHERWRRLGFILLLVICHKVAIVDSRTTLEDSPLLSNNGQSPAAREQPRSAQKRPHIVFVLADDAGFTDVGWNIDRVAQSEQQAADITPTLTKLARNGIIFDQAYALQMCSPSRAALLTGRHPIMYGMHDAVLRPDRAYGLPLDQRLLSEELRDLGYRTGLVGEWHLGFCNTSYMPTSRGFDSFFGPVTGRMRYYNHTYVWGPTYTTPSYVVHNNTQPVRTGGEYSTFLFARQARKLIMTHNTSQPLFLFLPFTAPHTPLASPRAFRNKALKLLPEASSKRRAYAAVLLALDSAVQSVVHALRMRRMWTNTIFVFMSDNGPNPIYGESYPLRGAKGTIFEGGMRVPAFLHGKMFPRQQYRERILLHISDWYPTLLSLAGGHPSRSDNTLDGVDLSQYLAARGKVDTGHIRQEMLYYLKVRSTNNGTCTEGGEKCCQGLMTGAYRYGQWKIVVVPSEKVRGKGKWYYHRRPTDLAPWLQATGYRTKWYDHRYEDFSNLIRFSDGNYWGLFHLDEDPYEEINLAHHSPVYFNFMRRKLLTFCSLAQMPTLWDHHKRRPVARANPKNFKNFWTHGWC